MTGLRRTNFFNHQLTRLYVTCAQSGAYEVLFVGCSRDLIELNMKPYTRHVVEIRPFIATNSDLKC